MIAYIEGKILSTEENSIIISTTGIGYELHCSNNTMDALDGLKETSLFVYTYVKEDILQLFGFYTKLEKNLFLSLIKVNGIGPKMAIQILSGATIETICAWIEEGDVKALTSLPKVGKKKAEQIILSLKGKLVLIEESLPHVRGAKQEIQSALVNLGFKINDVDMVIKELPETIEVEEGIRQSLQDLTAL